MDLSRRQFFKVAGIGLAGSSLGALGMAPRLPSPSRCVTSSSPTPMKPATPARIARSAAG
jgi:hypothetical protein